MLRVTVHFVLAVLAICVVKIRGDAMGLAYCLDEQAVLGCQPAYCEQVCGIPDNVYSCPKIPCDMKSCHCIAGHRYLKKLSRCVPEDQCPPVPKNRTLQPFPPLQNPVKVPDNINLR